MAELPSTPCQAQQASKRGVVSFQPFQQHHLRCLLWARPLQLLCHGIIAGMIFPLRLKIVALVHVSPAANEAKLCQGTKAKEQVEHLVPL